MSTKDFEERIDKSVARFDRWFAHLPFGVRLIGDVICVGFFIAIVAWLLASLGLFGLTSPFSWSISSWGYVLLVSVALGLLYELSFSGK